MTIKPPITSRMISDAICAEHTKDVVVTECKDGPTWTKSHARIDVWTMRRSWSKPRICGYEIKVSRSDFRQDDKWQEYLPLCNQLYFACPKGLIQAEEVPGQAGLVWFVGRSIRVVKKADYRNVEVPEKMYQYILMSRSRIVSTSFYAEETPESRLAKWRAWAKEAEEGHAIGALISCKVARELDEARREVERVTAENIQLAALKQMMKDLNIPLRSWGDPEFVRQRALNAFKGVPPNLVEAVKRLDREVQNAKRDILPPEPPPLQ